MTTSVFQAGEPVSLAIQLPFVGAEKVVATALTVTLTDEADVVIGTLVVEASALASLPIDQFEYELLIPGSMTALAAGSTSGVRLVSAKFTTSVGVITTRQDFVLTASQQLIFLQNSFVTYGLALMTRNDLPAMIGWDSSDENSRIAALKVAYSSLLTLRYRYPASSGMEFSRDTDYPDMDAAYFSRTGSVYVGDLSDITPEHFAALPKRFKDALARAQVTEADVMLNGDSIGAKRRSGIISETIGESSMFLRQSPEVRLSVSADAMSHLKGMTVRRTRIGRGS